MPFERSNALADKWLRNKQVVLHTDAAKSYRMKVAGIIHDNVVHQRKKVKVKGVWKWQLPKYVRLVSHSIPGSKKKMTVKAGTQVIDRAWRFLKERIVLNQSCKVGTARLRAKVRSAQYEYWHRNEDLWLCTGESYTVIRSNLVGTWPRSIILGPHYVQMDLVQIFTHFHGQMAFGELLFLQKSFKIQHKPAQGQ